jgi:hypothetical protein
MVEARGLKRNASEVDPLLDSEDELSATEVEKDDDSPTQVDMDADGKTKYILCCVSILHVYVLICHAARKAERNVGEEDDHEEAV